MIERVESVRMKGQEIAEMCICSHKVFGMVSKKSKAREEERARREYRKKLVQRVREGGCRLIQLK